MHKRAPAYRCRWAASEKMRARIQHSREGPNVTRRPIPNDDFSHAVQAPAAAATEECQLLAELSIIRDGRQYLYDGYQYDRLADAIAYAQLVRGQARQSGPSSPAHVESVVDSPTASDRQLMTELSIAFENGRFVFEGYRYDRLIDAVSYARHRSSSAAR